MPIRPEHRWFYPIDWPQLSAVIRFERAGGRCQRCGRPHGIIVYHFGDGRWWDAETSTWRNGRGRALTRLAPLDALPVSVGLYAMRVVLATAHLDHDPANNRRRNLRALCRRCHMLHDQEERQRRRGLRLRMRRALGDLFLGPYASRF